MEEYISKAVLVAEIEKRIKGLKDCHADKVARSAGEIAGLERLLSFIDTLEMKEVDLEKEIHKWIEDNTCRGYCSADIRETAEYFFELGIKGA